MDTTVVIGLGGLGSTLLAGLGGPIFLSLRNQRLKLREERVALYIDALLHVESLRRTTDWLCDPYYGGGSSAERKRTADTLSPTDLVSARMLLIADSETQRAWQRLVDHQDSLDRYLTENHPGGLQGEEALDTDDDWVMNARAVSDEMTRACRRAVNVTL